MSINRGDGGGENGLLRSSGIMVMLDTLTADCIDWMDGNGETAFWIKVSSMTDPRGDMTDPGLESTDDGCDRAELAGDVTELLDEYAEPGEVRLLTAVLQFEMLDIGRVMAIEPFGDCTLPDGVMTTVLVWILGGEVTEPSGERTENC